MEFLDQMKKFFYVKILKFCYLTSEYKNSLLTKFYKMICTLLCKSKDSFMNKSMLKNIPWLCLQPSFQTPLAYPCRAFQGSLQPRPSFPSSQQDHPVNKLEIKLYQIQVNLLDSETRPDWRCRLDCPKVQYDVNTAHSRSKKVGLFCTLQYFKGEFGIRNRC